MIYSDKTDSDWSSGKIESTLEEISLWATLCAIHWCLNGWPTTNNYTRSPLYSPATHLHVFCSVSVL